MESLSHWTYNEVISKLMTIKKVATTLLFQTPQGSVIIILCPWALSVHPKLFNISVIHSFLVSRGTLFPHLDDPIIYTFQIVPQGISKNSNMFLSFEKTLVLNFNFLTHIP